MKKFKLNFLHLADGATIDSLGKVSIFGIFGKIFLAKVPSKFLKFTLVGNISFAREAKSPIKVEIRVLDKKGKTLEIKPPIVLNFSIPEPKMKKGGDAGFIVDIGNLEFKSFGKYEVVVYADRNKVGSKSFTVEKRKEG